MSSISDRSTRNTANSNGPSALPIVSSPRSLLVGDTNTNFWCSRSSLRRTETGGSASRIEPEPCEQFERRG